MALVGLVASANNDIGQENISTFLHKKYLLSLKILMTVFIWKSLFFCYFVTDEIILTSFENVQMACFWRHYWSKFSTNSYWNLCGWSWQSSCQWQYKWLPNTPAYNTPRAIKHKSWKFYEKLFYSWGNPLMLKCNFYIVTIIAGTEFEGIVPSYNNIVGFYCGYFMIPQQIPAVCYSKKKLYLIVFNL